MSKRTYTNIDKQEFEAALTETGFAFKEVDYEWSGELIYEAESDNGMFTLRVYSSLSKHTGNARDKGSDAIRTVVIHTDTGRPVLKEKRTNRIQTWKKNLKKKINNMAGRQSDVEICSQCGNPMVIRTSKEENEFYGCTQYPECTYTKSIN